jgi:hypothetical protein
VKLHQHVEVKVTEVDEDRKEYNWRWWYNKF